MPKKSPDKEKFKAPLKGTAKIARLPSSRMLYLIIALVTAAFLVGGYLLYDFQEQHMRRRIEGELSIMAQLKADEIAQWRSERLVDANLLMGSPFFIEGVKEYMASPADVEARDKIIARLAIVGEAYPYQDVLLTDANGSVLLSLNDSIHRLGDMALAQLAVAIMEHKAVMTDFHYIPNGNSPRLDVVVPLFSWEEDSQPAIGAVVCCINPAQYLWPLVQSWPVPSETAETLLVERDGDQVLFLNDLRYQQDAALKLRIPLSQQENPAVMAVLGKEGVVEGKDYRGAEVLAALEHIPDSPWYMVAKVDTSEVLSALRLRAGIITVSLSGLLAAALAAIGLIWQRRQKLVYQALYQAEFEAWALRRHFEYLVKYANDIIILVDEDLHIVEANDRALEAYGYTREEMLGLPVAALIPPGAFSSYQERLTKLQKEGAIIAEAIHQRKDGSTFLAEISSRSIKIEGKPYIQTITRDITERRKAEREQSTILAAMSELVIYQDLEHRILWTNRAASDSVALAPEELVGRYCYEVWHQRSLPCVNCPVAQAREAGQFQENEISSPDGRFWQVRGYPVKDPGGTVSGAIEIVQDVTERRKAEAEYQTIIRTTMEGFWLSDMDGNFLDVNDAYCRLIGYRRDELLSMAIRDIEATETPEDIAERTRKVKEVGYDRFESRHRRKDGAIVDVDISINYLEVGGGRTCVFVRDITERKRAEEALADEAVRRRILMEQSRDGISILDEDSKLVEANQRFAEMLGYSPEELEDFHTWDWDAKWTREELLEMGHNVDAAGVHLETYHRRKDGTVFDVELSVNSAVVAGKKLLFCVSRDVTERRQAEKEMKASEARYKELADGITDVFFAMDRDLRYTYWNKASEKLIGIAVEDALGKHLYDIFPDTEETKEAENIYLEVLATREPRTFLNEYSLNGKNYWFEISAYPTETGLSVYVKDITERKLAEVEYKTIVATAMDGFAIHDMQGHFLDLNEAYCQLVGYSRGELLNMTFPDLEVTEQPDDRAKRIRRIVKEVGYDRFEDRLWHKDGGVVDVDVSVNYLPTDGGRFFVFLRDITERKQAEKALRLSEQNFRDSMENSPLGIRVLDKGGKKTFYANRAFLDIWGYSSIEVLEAVPRKQRYTPESYAEQVERLEKRRRGEDAPLNYELSIVRSDGQVRYLSVSRGELFWGGAKVFQLVYQDITKRKQAEEALRLSEQNLRNSIENSPLGIRIADEDGRTLYANRAFLDIWGYSSIEELEAVPRKQRYTTDSYDEHRARVGKRRRGKHIPSDYEISIVRSDGQNRHLSVSRGELLWGGAKVFQLVYQDITERKRVEEALRDSEARHRTLFETMAQGVVYQDAEGLIISANPAAERILGVTLDQMVGRTSMDPRWKAIHEDGSDFPGDTHPAMVALKIGKPVRNVLMGVFHPGFNEHVWLNVNAVPQFLDGEPKPYQVYTTFEDITERRRAAEELEKAVEELERSNTELERFAYVASHDLQEPLRMVSSYTQLLERRYKDKLDADANDFINYAVGGAERMQELLNDLLTYSRVGTRAKPFKHIDMEAVLEAALDNLQVSIKDSKARVTHDPLPTLMADEGQMVQVLQNLIGNAVKFRGEKSPRIHVSAEPRDSEWVFSVKDNGIGIEPQYFDRIFLIFQRLYRDEYPGTGTGLAIAKRIVERHGGRMWVESQPWKGSTFYFSIEAAGEKVAARDLGGRERGAASGGRRVKGGKRK